MNPALSFGPAVAYSTPDDGGKFWKYHYVYWVGPLVGTLVASLLYRLRFSRYIALCLRNKTETLYKLL